MVNRHSSSLSISTLFHIAVLVLFFNLDFDVKKNQQDEKMTIVYLCTYKEEHKETPKEVEKKEPVKEHKISKEKPKKIKLAKTEEIQHKIQEHNTQTQETDIQPPKQEEVPQTSIQESIEEQEVDIVKEVVNTQKQSSDDDYFSLNKDIIYTLIKDNLYYPLSARKRGIEGLVMIKFTINKNAEVCNIGIKESTSDILSKAAVQTIEELSKKFPLPSGDITLTIPIEYKLR